MSTYQLRYGFKITRRVAIDFESDEFHGHIARVLDHLGQAPSVVEHRATADLGSASLSLEVMVKGMSAADAGNTARRALAEGIREAGGAHVGLLPERDERQYFRVSFSGLRRQTWQQRSVDLVPA